MSQKSTKIDDVKRPGKEVPQPTSRPILVTNRPMIANDPMMVPAAQEADDAKPVTATVRTGKVIKPLDSTLTTSAPVSKEHEAPEEEMKSEAASTTVPGLAVDIDALHQADVPQAEPMPSTETKTSEAAETSKPKVAVPASVPEKASGETKPGLVRDPEAELSAEEIAAAEAQTKRDLELEQVVASGKYHVPINAVQRRRSRMHVVLLCIVGLLLALLLADVVIDAGFVKPPVKLPHTHFFSTTASGSQD